MSSGEFRAIAASQGHWVAEWRKKSGRKVIACLPMYIPEEIIHAAGMLPIVLQGSDETIERADEYLAPYLCHAVRSNFDLALRRELDFADGIVVPDLCDQTKRVGSLWALQSKLSFFDHLSFPKMLDLPGSREYLIGELERFRRAVAEFVGAKVSDQALCHSISVYNETRRLLCALRELRQTKPGVVPAAEVADIMAAAMLMPKEKLNPLLADYLETKRADDAPACDGVRLLLTGSPCEEAEPGFLELVKELGGVVVGDDLYHGEKYLGAVVAEEGEPIPCLADAYLEGIGCPTKQRTDRSWAGHVVAECKTSRAAGVVALLPKFCEIYAFDYPGFAQLLDREGIPHLSLEVDHSGVSGSLRTRLEAFIEIVRGE